MMRWPWGLALMLFVRDFKGSAKGHLVSILARYIFRVEGVWKLSFLGVLQKGQENTRSYPSLSIFPDPEARKNKSHLLAM